MDILWKVEFGSDFHCSDIAWDNESVSPMHKKLPNSRNEISFFQHRSQDVIDDCITGTAVLFIPNSSRDRSNDQFNEQRNEVKKAPKVKRRFERLRSQQSLV